MTAAKRGTRRGNTNGRVTPKGTRPATKKANVVAQGGRPDGVRPGRPLVSTGPVRGHPRPMAVPVRRTGNRGGR